MDTVLAPTNVVNDQQNTKIPMETTTLVKSKDYEWTRRHKLNVFALIFGLITCISYFIVLNFYYFTLRVVLEWKEQYANHTNINQIRMDCDPIYWLMTAYIFIIIACVFFVELNIIGRHQIAQSWKEHKMTASVTSICFMLYMYCMSISNTIQVNDSNSTKERFFKEEYTLGKLPKPYFYFQLAVLWFIFQHIIGHIILFLVRNQEIETKDDSTESSALIDKKKKACLHSKNKNMSISFIITIPDDKTTETPKIANCTIQNIK